MRKLFIIFGLALFTAACGTGDGGYQVIEVPNGSTGRIEGGGADSPVATLAIRPAYTKVKGIGKTLQLTADVFLDDDSVIEDVQKSFVLPGETEGDAHTVVWATDNFGVATVDENGLVTTVSAGDAFISATIDGLETVARVIVEAESSPDPSIDLSDLP
ncbi:MAG TPA: Ig-like domain-containing protein [bacterium]|nr:Ig-like domain-containing protein [bacterium]